MFSKTTKTKIENFSKAHALCLFFFKGKQSKRFESMLFALVAEISKQGLVNFDGGINIVDNHPFNPQSKV